MAMSWKHSCVTLAYLHSPELEAFMHNSGIASIIMLFPHHILTPIIRFQIFPRLHQYLWPLAPPRPLSAKLSYVDRSIWNISFPLLHHFDFFHKKKIDASVTSIQSAVVTPHFDRNHRRLHRCRYRSTPVSPPHKFITNNQKPCLKRAFKYNIIDNTDSQELRSKLTYNYNIVDKSSFYRL